ncbi:MAG: transglutaminase domain-containing protein [Bacillota bacterium]|jgi:transglutaminase-like putative cysteine protease|nr:transglutaminase domain-containing protein [Bacillota bacterium]
MLRCFKFFLLVLALLFLFAAPVLAGEVDVYLCGNRVEPSEQGIIFDREMARVMVPLSFFSQTFGAKVSWTDRSQEVIVNDGDVTVRMYVGRHTAFLEEEGLTRTFSLGAPAVFLKGEVFVPLRFVAEALGYRVSWDAESRTANIVPDLLALSGDAKVLDAGEPAVYANGSYYGFSLAEPGAGRIAARARFRVTGALAPGSFIKLAWQVKKGDEGAWQLFSPLPDGRFSTDVWLPFGPGEYIVDIFGVIREENAGGRYEWTGVPLACLKAVNSAPDIRFLAPINGINWDSQEIFWLAQTLTGGGKSEKEKVLTVHDWVAQNIAYDTQSYFSGNIPYRTALEVLQERLGVCEHYSKLAASLLRAAGIPAKVVYGYVRKAVEGWQGISNGVPNHAWNEVFIGGRWVTMDVTWDAGYLNGSSFVPAYTRKYFAPDRALYEKMYER